MDKWQIPSDIIKEVKVSTLNNKKLEYYHDQMHIFWNKIENGKWFGWTFREVYELHKDVLIEFLIRNIKHISPINNLDNIKIAEDIIELTEIINKISKK